jgi:hypothetical protein
VGDCTSHRFLSIPAVPLINTLLQKGGRRRTDAPNRFNGFIMACNMLKQSNLHTVTINTPLKWGVNETGLLLAKSPVRNAGLTESTSRNHRLKEWILPPAPEAAGVLRFQAEKN